MGLAIQDGDPLRVVVRAYAEYVLRNEDGNLSATARCLGISRNRLNRILNG